jgi:hypothetical protein
VQARRIRLGRPTPPERAPRSSQTVAGLSTYLALGSSATFMRHGTRLKPRPVRDFPKVTWDRRPSYWLYDGRSQLASRASPPLARYGGAGQLRAKRPKAEAGRRIRRYGCRSRGEGAWARGQALKLYPFSLAPLLRGFLCRRGVIRRGGVGSVLLPSWPARLRATALSEER